ncbi:hypothetical protein [Verrucomicrobium spinosum]|uniref:hypothetical protein n=1 Tax=Verrucomicrobium spinosum TaxID=2736 RepID=UPI0001745E44|nr:hypothetical protein [Verrucomicrobium spinosum]
MALGWIPLSIQAQSSALPFDRGVKIEVVASKPAPIRGGDWDDKTQKITLRLKFTNVDTRQSYEGHTAVVSALGQSAADRDVRIVFLQEKVDLPLTPLKSCEHTCKEIVTKFDKTGAKFGYAYEGWVILVKDAAGKVVYTKSTSPSLEKMPEKVEQLVAGTCFDRNLAVTSGDPVYTR